MNSKIRKNYKEQAHRMYTKINTIGSLFGILLGCFIYEQMKFDKTINLMCGLALALTLIQILMNFGCPLS